MAGHIIHDIVYVLRLYTFLMLKVAMNFLMFELWVVYTVI